MSFPGFKSLAIQHVGSPEIFLMAIEDTLGLVMEQGNRSRSPEEIEAEKRFNLGTGNFAEIVAARRKSARRTS
jgi:hypothetical protein